MRRVPNRIILLPVWVAAWVAVPMLAAGADWPQLQNDARRGGWTAEVVPPPYEVRWRWHPTDETVGIAEQVQPVVAGGHVYVGAYDGRVYALAEADGREAWSFPTGGPILGSAATAGQAVFFGSADGRVYAVDAATGALRWRRDLAGPISASPLLADGALYLGTRRGRFFALDAASGEVRWQYPAADEPRGAPFLCSAAYADGTVYVADEACRAMALDAATGRPRWTAQLAGQSVPWWPVVAADEGVAIFRTQPVYDHTLLREATYRVLEDGAEHTPDGPAPGTPQQRAREQANIREYLRGDPFLQTAWALDIRDGSQKFLAPLLYQAGGGGSPTPPVLQGDTGRAWTSHCSYYSLYDGGFFVQTGWYIDFGRMDLATGDITPATGPKGWEEFHLVADETTFLSMMGDRVLFAGWISVGSYDVSAQRSAGICWTRATEDKNESGLHADGGDWPVERLRSAGGSGAPAAVANGTIYWISPRGLLVAIRTKGQ